MVDTATTTMGFDRPSARNDHTGTVACPAVVSTCAVLSVPAVMVSWHLSAGTLSHSPPDDGSWASRAACASMTSTGKVFPSGNVMTDAPTVPVAALGARVTRPATPGLFLFDRVEPEGIGCGIF